MSDSKLKFKVSYERGQNMNVLALISFLKCEAVEAVFFFEFL